MANTLRVRITLVPALLSALSLGTGCSAMDGGPRPIAATDARATLRGMVGTWDVQTRTWAAAGAEPQALTALVAERKLVGGTFLEEVLTPAPGSAAEPFTRVAYLNWNDVKGGYEWVSMDTRAPQLMFETSRPGDDTADGNANKVMLHLDSFKLPRWGDATNVRFRQRRVIEVEPDHQISRQYWTPLAGGGEFLAVEYIYTRHR